MDESYQKDHSAPKGRTLGAQLAHMHNVRLRWFKASASDLPEGLPKIEDQEDITWELLKGSLEESAGQFIRW